MDDFKTELQNIANDLHAIQWRAKAAYQEYWDVVNAGGTFNLSDAESNMLFLLENLIKFFDGQQPAAAQFHATVNNARRSQVTGPAQGRKP